LHTTDFVVVAVLFFCYYYYYFFSVSFLPLGKKRFQTEEEVPGAESVYAGYFIDFAFVLQCEIKFYHGMQPFLNSKHNYISIYF